MLTHLVTEHPSAKAGALDPTLDHEPVAATAAVAYAVSPDGAEPCWIPARRRIAGGALAASA